MFCINGVKMIAHMLGVVAICASCVFQSMSAARKDYDNVSFNIVRKRVWDDLQINRIHL